VKVNLHDAEAFCDWLTKEERQSGKIAMDVTYRLPTDHEWSCAAGIGSKEDPAAKPSEKSGKIEGYSWGTAWPPPEGAGNYYGEEAAKVPYGQPAQAPIKGYRDDFPRTAPVGSFKPNELGLFDLGGNVQEWCVADFGNRFGTANLGVLRGESWWRKYDGKDYAVSSQRIGHPKNALYDFNGFRVVLELPVSGNTALTPAPPAPATDDVTKRLAEIDAQFQTAYDRDVAPGHTAAVLDLDTKYLAAVQRELDAATKAGRLNESNALRAEVKRITDKEPLPAADDPKLPGSLLKLRATYRSTLAKFEEARDEKSKAYHSRRDALLAEYHAELTRLGHSIDAQRVSALREERARRFTVPRTASQSPPAPDVPPISDAWANLPRPDGKPAKKTPRVKVFILMGGNMQGFPLVTGSKDTTLEYAVKKEKLYPFLYDESGNWTLRRDVRNVWATLDASSRTWVAKNEWLGVKNGADIGPEHGIGHPLGNAIEEPVMILKSCVGTNRSLGWDLLPPGSESFEFTQKDEITGESVTWVHAAYKGTPARWIKGTTPQPIDWHAGKQYDRDTNGAKTVLAKPGEYYPGTSRYEVEGFFWWQGEPDTQSAAYSSRYETNLVQLIKQLRKDFDAPKAKFVIATPGGIANGSTGNSGLVLDAMLAVDGGSGKYPEFKGNVATVYTNPLAKGGIGYNGSAKTYMDIGLAMGEAMVRLLENGKQ
ncbi:MAG TPA: SUMF1/EgtB/PvdO family nonheme iron enzyme, partial [Luteolibacter sp.]|nr:SUMF1/EgtB/PvdO family nonheme iron enzyme [Luteolibacter sp.]